MLSPRLVSRFSGISESLLIVVAVSFIAALCWNHYQLISFPLPLDFYEGAMPSITDTIASAQSPFSLDNQPARISVYPPLYNIIVAPLSLMLENSLEVHRLVAAIFILASAFICYRVTCLTSKSTVYGIASAAIFYGGLLYYSTPIASPNSVGLFFFLVSIVTPWFGNFSNRSLLYALIAGLLAFYGKQYFIASLGYISLYLFLAISKRKGLVFGICSLLFFVASLFLAQISSPYILEDTVFAVRKTTGLIGSNEVMLNQMWLFGKTYVGLLLILLIAVWFKFRIRNKPSGEGAALSHAATQLNLRDFDQPLFVRPLDYFWFCFACSFAVVALVVGKNPGNQMTYLFQLMSPFLLISIFALISGLGSYRFVAAPFILYSFFAIYTLLPGDFSVDDAGWNRVAKAMEGKEHIYSSPLVLPLLIKNGNAIYNNGHTVYFYYSRSKPEFLEKDKPDERVASLWIKHVESIHASLREKRYDLVVLDVWTQIPELNPDDTGKAYGQELLQSNYKLVKKVPVSLANRPGGGNYTMTIWKPRGTNEGS